MRDVQSVGHEITFPEDQESFPFLRQQLAKMSEKVGWRLRQQGLYARTVSIKVRFGDFKTITRSHTLDYSFNDDDTIFREALHLLEQVKLKPVRLLGVSVSSLSTGAQLSCSPARRAPPAASHKQWMPSTANTPTAPSPGAVRCPALKRARGTKKACACHRPA